MPCTVSIQPSSLQRYEHLWSHTAIAGHRRLRKGILNNVLYVGSAVWNRSHWMRHPVTKRFTYRVRPQDDWIEVDLPDLRIIAQDLWERAQTRMALHNRVAGGKPRRMTYLLSGFLTCGVCGASYTIRSRHAYGCGAHNSRGSVACSNDVRAPRKRLERLVVATLRDRLYTPDTLAALTAQVREALMARAREENRRNRQDNRAKELQRLEAEIGNIKRAVATGKATTVLGMLEERDRQRQALLAQADAPQADLQARLARALDRLPAGAASPGRPGDAAGSPAGGTGPGHPCRPGSGDRAATGRRAPGS